MKRITLLLVVFVLLLSCKEDKKEPDPVIHDTVPISEVESTGTNYPVSLNQIFKVHGGLEAWQAMRSLNYQITSRTGSETHTISLMDRKARIDSKHWSIGFDGTDVWKLERRENAYRGDPVFYYNLMFYFYAMPFVLGDEGINYEELKATELEGEVFEAIKISYNEGIGNSPKDEYILYYHPESYEMSWLAYTVTYEDDQPNEDWRYIKYGEWQEVNGLKLPKTLTWYTVLEGKPVQARNYRTFENVNTSEIEIEPAIFEMPEGGSKVVKE